MSNGVKDRGKGQGHAAEAIFDARTRPIVVVKFCQIVNSESFLKLFRMALCVHWCLAFLVVRVLT